MKCCKIIRFEYLHSRYRLVANVKSERDTLAKYTYNMGSC